MREILGLLFNKWVFFSLLALGGLALLVGKSVKELHVPLRRRKSMVVGVATMAKAPKAAWDNREKLATWGAVLTLGVAAVVLLSVARSSPKDRPVVALLSFVFAVSTWCAWDFVFTGGDRPFREVWDERKAKRALTGAVTTTHPGAVPGKVTLGQGEARVMVSHVGPLEHELVGQQLHAGYTELRPTDEMGRTEVIVRDEPPPPDLTTWEALTARGVLVLPSPDPMANRSAPRIGEDRHGNVHTLHPVVDPDKGCNVLIAGTTGAGKSVGMTTLLVELAWQRDVAWVGLDPHRVELRPWRSRMARCARGVEECVLAAEWLVNTMDQRLKHMDDEGIPEWRIGVDGPGILWIADEFAAFPTTSWRLFSRLCAEQRKMGMGCIIGTQRPEAKDVMPLNIRDNCRSRVAYAMMSTEGSKMVLEQRPPGAPDPTEIPEDCLGGYVALLNRTRLTGRGYLPCNSTSKHDISAYAQTIADSTAHIAPELEVVHA